MKINIPFFIINPKNYLNFDTIKKLAQYANKLAKKWDITVFFTAPSSYLYFLSQENESLIITAQDVFIHGDENTMGKDSFRNLQDINVKAVVLNHADSPLSISQIIAGINQANKQEMVSIVCANSVQEAKMIAQCHPTIILAEETKLIGGAEISHSDFLDIVIKEIKSIDSNILVEYGAGIRTAEDIERILETGVDGVGVTSGIVKAQNSFEMTENMLNVIKNKKKKG